MSRRYGKQNNERYGERSGDNTDRQTNRQPQQRFSKVKSPATVEDQIEKLRSRGCIIEDYDHAVCALSNINYYRLAHYFAIFLETKSHYREGTSFEAVMHIYDFDRMMRSLLMTTLEEVEITMRANISTKAPEVRYQSTPLCW